MSNASNNCVTSNSIWIKKGIAPLEYCSIDRAARLLDCEQDDILHWSSIGAINPSLMLRHYCIFPLRKNDATRSISSTSTYELEPLTDEEKYRAMFYNSPSRLGGLMVFDTNTERYRADNETRYLPVQAFGLWSPSYSYYSIYKEIISGNQPLLSSIDFMQGEDSPLKRIGEIEVSIMTMTAFKRWFMDVTDAYSDENLQGYVEEGCGIEEKTKISRADIFISRQQIEHIFKHSLSGEPMPLIEGSDGEFRVFGRAPEASKIHANAERFAIDREKLLKFAIYILSKYPDECRGERKEVSPEKWRDSILKYHHESEGVIIPNEQVMLRQLRAAVNGSSKQ